jgi:hypothetical protein
MDGMMEKGATEPASFSERPQSWRRQVRRRATWATLLGEAKAASSQPCLLCRSWCESFGPARRWAKELTSRGYFVAELDFSPGDGDHRCPTQRQKRLPISAAVCRIFSARLFIENLI